jgi:serine/threonine protein kinase
MPTNLIKGEVINGYKIIQQVNTGALANSYIAEKDNDKYFFKHYKSPSVRVKWYRDYVEYQKELNELAESNASGAVISLIDQFEDKYKTKSYYQVFEFMKDSQDLSGIIAKREDYVGDKILTFAKVFMLNMKRLHEAGIVHCDLKPKNIFLIKDSEVAVGYRLKIADIDYSILSEKQAPWHGEVKYIGTPDYFSPEHKDLPVKASDIFTCGLILYEMLSKDGKNPYADLETEEYFKSVEGYKAKPPVLIDELADNDKKKSLCTVMHQCLNPDKGKRPTASDILEALKAVEIDPKYASSLSAPVTAAVSTVPITATSSPSSNPVKNAETLVLQMKSGKSLRIKITTKIGKHMDQVLGDDAKKFMHDEQFTVQREPGGWLIAPNASATNETILNGKAIKSPTALKSGDIIGVGNESKNIIKIPMEVSFC